MEDNKNTLTGETGTEGTEKTFTQDEVNRIVQERLAKEKGKGETELQKRMQELDMRERKMNATQRLRENGLPDYLVDALNMETDEAFNASIDAVIKMQKESKAEEPKVIGHGDLIGRIGGLNNHTDPIRKAFGLDG